MWRRVVFVFLLSIYLVFVGGCGGGDYSYEHHWGSEDIKLSTTALQWVTDELLPSGHSTSGDGHAVEVNGFKYIVFTASLGSNSSSIYLAVFDSNGNIQKFPNGNTYCFLGFGYSPIIIYHSNKFYLVNFYDYSGNDKSMLKVNIYTKNDLKNCRVSSSSYSIEIGSWLTPRDFVYFPSACFDANDILHIVAQNNDPDVDYFILRPGASSIEKVDTIQGAIMPSIDCIRDWDSEFNSNKYVDIVAIAYAKSGQIYLKTYVFYTDINSSPNPNVSYSGNSPVKLLPNTIDSGTFGRPKIRLIEAGYYDPASSFGNGNFGCLAYCGNTPKKYNLLSFALASEKYDTQALDTLIMHGIFHYKDNNVLCSDFAKYTHARIVSGNNVEDVSNVHDVTLRGERQALFLTTDSQTAYWYRIDTSLIYDTNCRAGQFAIRETKNLSLPTQINKQYKHYSDGANGILFVSSNTKLTYYHEKLAYSLTINKYGSCGTLTSNPAGINCGTDCTENYNPNDVINLSVQLGTKCLIDSWGGDCASCGNSSTCQITMDTDKVCTINFIYDNNPPTCSISINNGNAYTNSTSVTLSISASDNVTSTPNLQMCVSESTTCSSWKSFTSSKYFTLSSANGTKRVYVKIKDEAGNVGQCSDTIVLDTQPPTTPTLTATAGDGRITLNWTTVSDSTSGFKNFVLRRSTGGYPSCTSGTQVYSGTGTSYTDTGLTNGTTYYYRLCAYDKAGNYSSDTVSATPQTTKYTLTVNKTGSGTVTSNPAGINCGTICSAQFNRGTSVTLAATPANGYYFGGWSGCDSASGNSCTVNVNSNKTVSATFSACTYSLSPTNKTFNYKGGTGNFNVSTNSACSWTASSNCSWVTITSGSNGTGNGTVRFSVSSYSGTTQRTCSISVGGKTFTIVQSPNNPPTTPTVTGSSSGQTGQALSFTATSSDPEGDTIQYRFDWGDGSISDWGNATQSYTWSSAGNYCVKAQARDSNRATSNWSSCFNVSVDAPTPTNNPPVIDSFTANPSSGDAPLTVTFSWNISDPDGDALTCQIDVDNDGTAEQTINNCTSQSTYQHTYNNAGTYAAKLTVTDGKDGQVSKTVQVRVSNPPPPTPTNNPPVINSFTANPSSGDAPLTVTFSWDISDPDGDTLTCRIDVDNDGTFETVISDCSSWNTFWYIYQQPRTYIAKIVVLDGRGGEVFETVQITVNNTPSQNSPPVIHFFSANPDSGNSPLTVKFSWGVYDPDNDPLKCSIDVNGDGIFEYTIDSCDSTYTQTHRYDRGGNYTVEFVIEDGKGNQAGVTATVNVINPPPVVSAMYAYPSSGSAPLTVSFTCDAYDSNGHIAEYRWDFDGDGVIDRTGSSNSESYTYYTPGNYTVRCIVVDNEGATNENNGLNDGFVTVRVTENNSPPVTIPVGGDNEAGGAGGCSMTASSSGEAFFGWLLNLLIPVLVIKGRRYLSSFMSS